MRITKDNKIAVIGDNAFSVDVVSKLLRDDYYSVICYLTNKTEQVYSNNLPVYRISEAKHLFNSVFDTILILDDMPYQSEFYYDLYMNNFDNVFIMTKESNNLFNGNKIDENCLQVYNLQEKPILKYIEMHITDQCNLKCKGCTHFSSLFDKNETNFENFCNDVDELSKRFNIPIIRLMGGEALLIKDLYKYLNYIRQKFPQSKIFVVSNGLLVPKMSDEICEAFMKNNIVLNMTIYQPTYKQIENIEKFLSEKGITHFYGQGHKEYSRNDLIENFHTCLTADNNREIKDSGYSKCYGKYCWMLRNGLISKCCYPLLVYKLNEKYGTDFKVDSMDCYKLSEVNNSWDLISKLSNSIPFCKYCSNQSIEFKWHGFVINPNLNDFIKE